MKACFKLRQLLFAESNIPIKIHLQMFDAMIKPILLYCTEVWTADMFTNAKTILTNLTNPMEKLHMKFCKYILKVNNKASNIACLMELGRYPLIVSCITQMVKYWLKICKKPDNTLTREAYDLGCQLNNANTDNWVSGIKQSLLLLNSGHSIDVKIDNDKQFIKTDVNAKIKQLFEKHAFELINNDTRKGHHKNKLRTYRELKKDFSLESYLQVIKNPDHRSALCKLRISAHILHIETGRYKNINVKDRECPICQNKQVEDEIHFLFHCNGYNDIRHDFFSKLNICKNTFRDTQDIISIFSRTDKSSLCELGKYIHTCFQIRQNKLKK